MRGIHLFVVPSVGQTDATDEIDVDVLLVVGSKDALEVNHEVKVGGHELVAVGLVEFFGGSFAVHGADVNSSSDHGRPHGTDTTGEDGGFDVGEGEVCEGGLKTSLNADESVGIFLLPFFLRLCALHGHSAEEQTRHPCFEVFHIVVYFSLFFKKGRYGAKICITF